MLARRRVYRQIELGTGPIAKSGCTKIRTCLSCARPMGPTRPCLLSRLGFTFRRRRSLEPSDRDRVNVARKGLLPRWPFPNFRRCLLCVLFSLGSCFLYRRLLHWHDFPPKFGCCLRRDVFIVPFTESAFQPFVPVLAYSTYWTSVQPQQLRVADNRQAALERAIEPSRSPT